MKKKAISLKYRELLKEIKFYIAEGREESAAFLMWYFEKYRGLDSDLAIDSVCDGRGDRGVDGIYVDKESAIEVFQVKTKKREGAFTGEKEIKEFQGTLDQFSSKDKLENLIKEAGKAEVAGLVKRLKIVSKLDNYEVKGVFVSNANLSPNGKGLLKKIKNIEFVGRDKLESDYISEDEKTSKVSAKFTFKKDALIKCLVDEDDAVAYLVPVEAKELVELQGIKDRSIFDLNVRGSLGRTKINKEIEKSIEEKKMHKQFLSFHNGITIVAEKVQVKGDSLMLENFHVVNGCQSLVSLFNKKNVLTDDLKLLVKIIKVRSSSSLLAKITEYSNNQNAVKPRDFKSNDTIQKKLQKKVSEFGKEYFYSIKRGEPIPDKVTIIPNDKMGIYLMSFYLEEPWNTHRKYQVFEDAYEDIFNEANAHKIIFMQILYDIIKDEISALKNELLVRYALTKYLLLYLVKCVLKEDETGKELIEDPSDFVKIPELRERLKEALMVLVKDIIVDLDIEFEEISEKLEEESRNKPKPKLKTEGFDYKSSLRNKDWVKKIRKPIISSYKKQVNKGDSGFEYEWEKARKTKTPK